MFPSFSQHNDFTQVYYDLEKRMHIRTKRSHNGGASSSPFACRPKCF
jgi:hypothetical protein